MPIDSAPRNTRVLIKFDENDNNPVIATARHYNDNPIDVLYWYPDDYGDIVHFTYVDPTHWMPLPKAPEKE